MMFYGVTDLLFNKAIDPCSSFINVITKVINLINVFVINHFLCLFSSFVKYIVHALIRS